MRTKQTRKDKTVVGYGLDGLPAPTHLIPLQDMVDEAIEFLRRHEPPEGYTLADSFGKDSTVLWELAKMADVGFVHIHNRTGIDPPELVKHGRETRPGVVWIPPRMTLWDGIRKWFPPTVQIRWCCSEMKEHRKKGLPTSLLVGIRGEESPRRKARERISRVGTVVHYKPIFNWTYWHVWEFIDSMGLPYCSLYDEGFDRLGCVVCPMITSKNRAMVDRNRKRWPGFYKSFEHAVTWWFWNKAWWDRVKYRQPQKFLDAWYRSFK